jgi:7-cyano-7-deazaguanine synthase
MEVLLFSGGIESTCLAFMRRPDICLTVDYGQKQSLGEIRAATNISKFLQLDHQILTVDLCHLGSGQMSGRPAIKSALIPEFWPFRNQLLITLCAMKFAYEDNVKIIIGSTKSDSSHVDGTYEFVTRLRELLLIQEGRAELIAPAICVESLEFIRESQIDPDILDMTFSCFAANYPCGRCRGCLKNETLRALYYDMKPTCRLERPI